MEVKIRTSSMSWLSALPKNVIENSGRETNKEGNLIAIMYSIRLLRTADLFPRTTQTPSFDRVLCVNETKWEIAKISLRQEPNPHLQLSWQTPQPIQPRRAQDHVGGSTTSLMSNCNDYNTYNLAIGGGSSGPRRRTYSEKVQGGGTDGESDGERAKNRKREMHLFFQFPYRATTYTDSEFSPSAIYLWGVNRTVTSMNCYSCRANYSGLTYDLYNLGLGLFHPGILRPS
ncbi:unnamed protein product [Nesidiocoris tenuis]|uniref:Uncharacterized protein n=1 Tax=Nesidiocoris tenuis TaxID=355587 RepID=A0A6H5H134_9HEMI|nr:unnamed protein product [Nesidiocoris tenuis]